MTIAVLGAGAIGGLYTGILAGVATRRLEILLQQLTTTHRLNIRR